MLRFLVLLMERRNEKFRFERSFDVGIIADRNWHTRTVGLGCGGGAGTHFDCMRVLAGSTAFWRAQLSQPAAAFVLARV